MDPVTTFMAIGRPTPTPVTAPATDEEIQHVH
jgi:hypothetical protein